MQTRSRRAHGLGTRKVSISVSREDLRVLSSHARRFHRGNLSAVIHEMAAALRREEALGELLDMLGADRVSDEDVQAIRDEVAGARRRRPKRKRSA